MTALDAMLSAAAGGTAEIAPGWGQGRATYGGLLAAMMLARGERVVGDAARRLRVATITFVGPVAPGPADIECEVLRAGKSATTIAARILQGGAVGATLVASFGQDRATRIEIEAAAAAPPIPAPAELEPIPYIEGLLPEFAQHVELRYGSGAFPFAGAHEGEFGGWMRFREPTARFGDIELVALVDVWPPGVAPMFQGPGPMSTLTWTYEPVGEPAEGEGDPPDAHWQYDVRTLAASGGYASTSARVWDASGRLRAISRQTVAYFQ